MLGPQLQDHTLAVHNIAELPPLLNRQRGGFLQVNILSCQGSFHGRLGMPVVRSGNDHRIHVRMVEHVVEVCGTRDFKALLVRVGDVLNGIHTNDHFDVRCFLDQPTG